MPLPTRWQWKLDRWRERLRGGAEAERESPRPRLCPQCGTLVGATASRCHECGASMTFSLAAISKSFAGIIPSETPVTYVLFGVNLLMFVVSMAMSMGFWEQPGTLRMHSGALYLLGARETGSILSGEWWRLVMPIFLHGGLLHIMMNSLVLLDLGPQIEELYGSPRYFFLYMLTGICGSLASTWWYPPGAISIGASGALMGLLGIMLAITQRRGGSYMRAVRAQLLKWLGYIVLIGLITRTDNAAHFGGLAVGYVLGRWVFDDREPATAGERQRANWMGWSAAVVVVVSFVLMLLQLAAFYRSRG